MERASSSMSCLSASDLTYGICPICNLFAAYGQSGASSRPPAISGESTGSLMAGSVTGRKERLLNIAFLRKSSELLTFFWLPRGHSHAFLFLINLFTYWFFPDLSTPTPTVPFPTPVDPHPHWPLSLRVLTRRGISFLPRALPHSFFTAQKNLAVVDASNRRRNGRRDRRWAGTAQWVGLRSDASRRGFRRLKAKESQTFAWLLFGPAVPSGARRPKKLLWRRRCRFPRRGPCSASLRVKKTEPSSGPARPSSLLGSVLPGPAALSSGQWVVMRALWVRAAALVVPGLPPLREAFH